MLSWVPEALQGWVMGFGFLGIVVLFFFFPTVFFLIIRTGKALVIGFLIALLVIMLFFVIVGSTREVSVLYEQLFQMQMLV
jgi:hypothetical protein